MINISFKYDAEHNPIAFRCLGHAGFAKAGRDIICASVTALVFNAANSIENFTEDGFELEANDKKGYLYLSLKTPSHDSILLLKSLELGIRGIIKENGTKYVSLIDWEV